MKKNVLLIFALLILGCPPGEEPPPPEPVPVHEISVEVRPIGRADVDVSPSRDKYFDNEIVAVTVVPDDGWKLKFVELNGERISPEEKELFSFEIVRDSRVFVQASLDR